MKKILFLRPGTTLVEMILFIGLLAMMSGTMTSVYIATQEARIEQEYVSAVEQRGILLLNTITKFVRRSEAIITPTAGQSGSILTLQMAQNAEYPTILLQTSTGRILLAQKSSVFELLDRRTSATGFTIRNIGGTTAKISFDLLTVIPTVKKNVYKKHFESTITLFPDDALEGGGCGTCPNPVCSNHTYEWHECQNDVCVPSSVSMPC